MGFIWTMLDYVKDYVEQVHSKIQLVSNVKNVHLNVNLA